MQVEAGVRLQLRLSETGCLKTARSDAACDARPGQPARSCQVELARARTGALTVTNRQCNADGRCQRS